MGLFDSLEIDNTKELGADNAGTGGGVSFDPIEKTGVYKFRIQNAYADASEIKEFDGNKTGGALFIKLELVGSDGKLETHEYVTGGVQKGRKPTFVYDKYRKLHYLLTGEDVEHIPTEPKQIMVWDFNARQEVEMTKEVITSWIGKEITAACERTLEDKFNADGEIKDFVVVRAFLDAKTNRSYAEVKGNEEEASYANEFIEKRGEEYVVDKRDKTKSLPIPTILTKEEKEALKAKEKEEAEAAFGSDEVDVNEEDTPFG